MSPVSYLESRVARPSRPLLIDLYDSIYEGVGHQEEVLAFAWIGNHIRFAPEQQIQIGHRIIVVWPQRNRPSQGLDSRVNGRV